MEIGQYSEVISNLIMVLRRVYPRLTYHNFNHAFDVYQVSRDYAEKYLVAPEDMFILNSSALLHDVIYDVGAEDNEERSALYARGLLEGYYVSQDLIQRISNAILATKWPTNPKNLLEKIICDADIDNLGRKDFFEKSRLLLIEWEIPEDLNWYRMQSQLLENNHYYTGLARKTRDEGRKENAKIVRKILQEYELKEFRRNKRC